MEKSLALMEKQIMWWGASAILLSFVAGIRSPILGGVWTLVGAGLLLRKHWARRLFLVLTVFQALVSLSILSTFRSAEIFQRLPQREFRWFLYGVSAASFLWAALAIRYFTRAYVKNTFTPGLNFGLNHGH